MKKTKTIIVADDEENITSYLKILLQDYCDEVLTASNGEEAFEIFQKHPHTLLILSDIKMPQLDGLQLLRQVRRIDKEVPVIFFTGFGCEDFMKEALEYGAYDFIDKPNLEGLEETVKHLVKDSDKQDQASSDDRFLSTYRKMLKAGHNKER